MLVFGLTGSIAMGKSYVARRLARRGIPVFDSDAMVHALMKPDGAAFKVIVKAFGKDILSDGWIDRQRLGALIFNNPASKKRLESILHPLVRRSQKTFFERCRRNRVAIAVVDVPLLFETQGHRLTDFNLVVSSSRPLQRQRALRRPGMSVQRLNAIIGQQMPDHEKRKLADAVILSGYDRGFTSRQIGAIIERAFSDLREGGVMRLRANRTVGV